MPSEPRRGVSRDAKEIFAALAARTDAAGRVDIDAAIAERPELERELRDLHAGWLRLDRLLGSIRVDSSVLDAVARDASLEADPPDEDLLATLDRLRGSRSARERYEDRGRIATGGMGEVLRVHDRDLGRDLAMKIAHSKRSGARHLKRFLFEARLTARLDHPGIVPVHDVGVDADGRLWFTMPLVRGSTLSAVLEFAREGRRGWSRTRILEVILRVCDTLEFAHAAGVVHRDLKPSNILVGDYGETYVVDWGLARAPETSDEQGDVLGTPAYMAPEQAEGLLEVVGPRADVYSVGAILYHLLSGHRPFAASGSSQAVLEALRTGPPAELELEVPDAPAELVAICRKAMDRDPLRRYPGVCELSEDLRAWMEGRVVRSYESGAWPELRKWISRNRALAGALAVALALAVGGLAAVSWVQARGKAEVLRLADVRRLSDLESRAEELWPATPDKAAAMERWLGDAGILLEHLPSHQRALAAMSASDLGSTEGRWRRDVLSTLVADLSRLRDPDPALGLVADVRARLDLARTLRERSLEEHAAAWEQAVRSIGDEQECPAYHGLRIAPQLGLVPVGRDPRSGLWEFAHLPSGEPPSRSADGSLRILPESSLVLVLIPEGGFEMGSQAPTPGLPIDARTDPLARENEMPLCAEHVGAFFLSKFEMTRAQWRRAQGSTAGTVDAAEALLPADLLSHPQAERALRHLGLAMPGEVQWEYAARASTRTRWWTGSEARTLVGAENAGSGIDSNLPYDDGWAEVASVQVPSANPWGLCHALGNVAEWTADSYSPDHRAGTPRDPRLAVVRGGSFRSSVRDLRAAARAGVPGDNRSREIGLRPARALE